MNRKCPDLEVAPRLIARPTPAASSRLVRTAAWQVQHVRPEAGAAAAAATSAEARAAAYTADCSWVQLPDTGAHLVAMTYARVTSPGAPKRRYS